MKAGILLLIIHDVIEGLVHEGILTPTGDFTSVNISEDIRIAVMVETTIKARGITVQSDVDKILNALPIILPFIK